MEYIGKHQKGAESLFDAMIADLFCDKEKRTEKFMRTHDRRGKSKDKRKSYEKERYYKFDPWHGLEPVSHYRHRVYVESLLKDFDAELHQHEDAMQEYADYCLMAEQHEERLEYLRNLTGNVEFWEIMINEISREKIYEENRTRQMMDYAHVIYADEEYFRKQKSFGIRADLYIKSLRSPWDFE